MNLDESFDPVKSDLSFRADLNEKETLAALEEGVVLLAAVVKLFKTTGLEKSLLIWTIASSKLMTAMLVSLYEKNQNITK